MSINSKEKLDSFPKADGQNWPMGAQKTVAFSKTAKESPWPKISIVTPSYNQGPYLEKTIRSVLLQGYPHLEYLIIDGGSSDESVEVIKKYAPWLTYWVSEKDRGQSHAINKGFEQTTGELIGWLNSDDWYTEGALFKLAEAYLEDKTVGAIYGQGYIVNEFGQETHTPNLLAVDHQGLLDWADGNDFMQPSCLFTKDAWRNCGPLDEGLYFSLDVDLWLKISKRYQFKKIDDLLSYSLAHSKAKTTAMNNEMFAELAVVLMRHGGEVQARKILDHFVNRLNEHDQIKLLANKIPFLMNSTKIPILKQFLKWLVRK